MEAEVWNFSGWISDTDPYELREKYLTLLIDCKFEILNFTEHFFQPQGYTCLWLLGESHFAIHTFPEQGRTYIELTSCNPLKHDKFVLGIVNLIDKKLKDGNNVNA